MVNTKVNVFKGCCEYAESESEALQLCPTPCDPTDCRLPGSSVRGIFQARVLEWVAMLREVELLLPGSSEKASVVEPLSSVLKVE